MHGLECTYMSLNDVYVMVPKPNCHVSNEVSLVEASVSWPGVSRAMMTRA